MDCSGSAGSADEFHLAHFRCVLLYLVTRATLRGNVFGLFAFLSSKAHTFESVSGKLLSRNALKVGVLETTEQSSSIRNNRAELKVAQVL